MVKNKCNRSGSYFERRETPFKTKMAAPSRENSRCWKTPEVFKHHEQRKTCFSRPKYREGRKAKAVKVYTIHLESRYVMVQGVPAVGVMEELVQLCALYGTVEEYRPLHEYPAEQFTEVYLIKFQKLTSARAAKRHMDEKSFYGGVLHVCYVPEHETVEDTRLKLQDRRQYIRRTLQNIAKERRKMEDVPPEASSSSSSKAAAVTSCPTENDKTKDSSWSYDSCGFPLLPLPPQEHDPGPSHYGRSPAEDHMGTLHHALHHRRSSDQTKTSDMTRPTDKDQPPLQVRFLPRKTQLDKRKRKEEQTETLSKCDVTQSHGFIGPKLPEDPKTDMEDDSLNSTVKRIRETLKQVEAVAEVKPVEKKVKPRRRI